MVTFLALYRGDDLPTAKMIAVTCDQNIVTQVADSILRAPSKEIVDPVLAVVDHGRRRALRLVVREGAER